MAVTNSNADTKVVTGEVRIMFPHLFEKYTPDEDQDPKYSVMLLVPKEDTATVKKIQSAQQAALKKGKDSKFGGKIPNNWKNTFRDGDEEGDEEDSPERLGHYFMTVSSKTRPGVVDRLRQAIMEPQEVYSGCYARVSLNAFPYNSRNSKGVSFAINGLQKTRDGEALGGPAPFRAEEDFEELEPLSEDEDGSALI